MGSKTVSVIIHHISEPSLRTLCLLKIIQNNDQLDVSVLPRDLRNELNAMVMKNQLAGPSNASG
jgi:hypothetical protein